MNTIIIALISAAAASALTWLVMRSRIQALKEIHQKEMENSEKLSQQAQANYERALKEMKETLVASMTAETEKLLNTVKNKITAE